MNLIPKTKTGKTILTLIAMAALCVSVAAQQSSRLEKIEVVGLKRMTSDQVIALTGLQIGQAVDATVLDAAANKLMQTGMFRHLGYRVRSSSDGAVVVFNVEESAIALPVTFENFVWFSDDEIAAAIRRDVPFFNGTAPATGDTTDKIAAALERLLASRNIKAHVEYLPYVDLSNGKQELLFTATGAHVPICSLHFPGASAVSESELIKASGEVLNTEYSKKDIATFAPIKLIPLYRHRGYLRAEFQPATVTVETSAACPGGVSVTVPVEEGVAYTWSGSEWNGNDKLTVDDLAGALGMNPGELADGLKIDKGLKEVRRAYARRGYLNAQVKESIEFAEGRPAVRYIFNVTEGPRYFMGNLVVTGLAPADAEALKSKWTLNTNSVFDESYVDQFQHTTLREFVGAMVQRNRGASRKVEIQTRPDARKLTVDVLINFK
jgi:outer membrane protein insertion porin family